MIDNDVDEAFDAMAWMDGPWWLVLMLLLVCGLGWVASENRKDCAHLDCPHGGHAVLMEHDCRCVEEPVR